METSENFCLKWSNFESNLSDAFKELRDEKDLFDVTLACDDRQVAAHKVVLSACSPFFRNILRRNPHPHPLLYIKGVKYDDLLSMLNFMYLGEVNIVQDELSSFLAAAEELKIKGLTPPSMSEAPNIENQESPKQLRLPRVSTEKENLPPSKRPRPTPTVETVTNQLDRDFTAEDAEIKVEIRELESPSQDLDVTEKNSEVDDSYNHEPYFEVEEEDENVDSDENIGAGMESIVTILKNSEENAIEKDDPELETFSMDFTRDCFADFTRDWEAEVSNKMSKKKNTWHCVDCGNENKKKTAMISHVQGKHLEEFAGYVCKLCGGKSGTYCGFEKHIYRKHKSCFAKNKPGQPRRSSESV